MNLDYLDLLCPTIDSTNTEEGLGLANLQVVDRRLAQVQHFSGVLVVATDAQARSPRDRPLHRLKLSHH